jgi:hypothetical protein
LRTSWWSYPTSTFVKYLKHQLLEI